MFILDVGTQWNSMYIMLNRALKLKKFCSTYCGSESRCKFAKFSLLNTKSDKVAQMVSFLEPLSNVTKILCCSKLLTLSMGLSIYFLKIKNIYYIQTKYNTSQLIPAAEQMIKKLKKYLVSALEKPAPLCSMILNPCIKLRHLEKSQFFSVQHKISYFTVDDTIKLFEYEAQDFYCSPTDIFGEATLANDLSARTDQYISEPNENSKMNVLTYWSHHTKMYPSLSLMAKSYLGITATSAPSKQNLVCVKDWYQKYHEMIDITSVTTPASLTHSDDYYDLK
ncbi:uncharacterized protein VP01_3213g3 [Puccinia sorghi]|uniref:HAT C-terminal dimerisation domain-containing protein n=1 Tax=Puccinia sorghi TaxID=27349 RepID=A0A0L6V078_9BASI|nr:uncharacterized protein VP01_3213g3 [Puccinia sorghi]